MRCSRLVCLVLAAVCAPSVSSAVTSSQGDHPPAAVRVSEGGSAVLECDPPEQQGDVTTTVVEWISQNHVLPIFLKFGIHPPRVDAAYLGRLSLQGGASLRVNAVCREDEGWYRCRLLFLTQPHGDHNGSWIHLSVTAPPTFRITPPAALELFQGDPARLECEADGVPAPMVSGGRLEIGSVGAWSRGVYTCEAHSVAGNISHSTTLLVTGPPIIVQPPQNTTVNVSQDAVFQCQVEAYPLNVTYAWSKHGVNVHQISELRPRVSVRLDGSLLLTSATPLDSGWYTCTASNGMGKSPRATAHLSVLHPAYSRTMPPITVLVSGQAGRIRCPTVSNPPLSHVSWSKDGHPLTVTQLPGWSVDDEGAIVIGRVDQTAQGHYSCTPYNRLGTLGSSSPTHVVLKDPPRFVERPAASYQQEIGRELRIGCSATGDPQPRVSWSKVGGGSAHYRVLEDGTLVLRAVSREHHGLWECVATTNVARVTSNTQLQVTGTSPHAPSELTVSAGSFGVNVSWCPGFDGGHQQHFSVWFRQAAPHRHDWILRRVPPGGPWLWVEGLWPQTCYQFSVLAQSDRGSSPFSEIVTAWTLSVPKATSPPRPPVTKRPHLLPPRSPTANRTQDGILLCWEPPLPPSPTPTAYLLESWAESGWRLMHSAIPASRKELLLRGLLKDSVYHLRLRSRRGQRVSSPSQTVNVSTVGVMTLPPRDSAGVSLDGAVRAGVIAGSCFLATAVTVSALVSCVSNLRRGRQRQDVPIIFSRFQKSPETQRSNSPDSVLKLKIPIPVYETFPSVPRSPQSMHASRGSLVSIPLRPLQGICRGPDGRFVVEPEPGIPQPGGSGLGQGEGPSPPGQGACRYFALACSSPAGEYQPPCIRGLSPIPASPAPGSSFPPPGTDWGPAAGVPARGPGPQLPELPLQTLPPHAALMWGGTHALPGDSWISPAGTSGASPSGWGWQRMSAEAGALSREMSWDGDPEWEEEMSTGMEGRVGPSTGQRPPSVHPPQPGRGPQDTGQTAPCPQGFRPLPVDRVPSPSSRCAALWAEFQELRESLGSWRQGGGSHHPRQQATLL